MNSLRLVVKRGMNLLRHLGIVRSGTLVVRRSQLSEGHYNAGVRGILGFAVVQGLDVGVNRVVHLTAVLV